MVVFQLARRDLVLLRDILRLGTATSVLLRTGLIGRKQILQYGPDTAVVRVPVVRFGIRQPDPACAA